MASLIVIKVKYGDTLRRFNASLNEGKQLEFDIEGLKAKIRALFNFPLGALLTLTYIDEDEDVVALIDDNDVRDVVRQALNPVRINVHLNTGKPDKPKQSSRSSAHRSSPIHNSGVADLLKSVPESIRDPLTTLSSELASKAASSSPPVLAELIDAFTKMGQAVLVSQTTRQPAPTDSAACNESGEDSLESSAGKVDVSVPSPDGTQQLQPSKGTPSPTLKNKEASTSAIPKKKSAESAANCSPSGDKQKSTRRIQSPDGCLPKKGTKSRFVPEPPQINQFSMEYVPPPNQFDFANYAKPYVPPPSLFHPANYAMPYGPPPYLLHPANNFGETFNPADNSRVWGTGFHSGVCCDGCGIVPITGPRYKSKVKYNYDLCQICFQQKGNDSDYQRLDYPASHPHPWSLGTRSVPFSAAAKSMRNHFRPPRLESIFIADITIADGTIMAPKTPFTKIWRMCNSGPLPWPVGVQLVWIGGAKFADTDIAEVEIPSNGLGAEEELDVAISFVAPEVAGRYTSYWRLASPSGQKFGQRVWVQIQVDSLLDDTTHDTTENCGVDLNIPPPPEYTIQNPKLEQAGHNDDMLADIGYDGENKKCSVSHSGSAALHDPLPALSLQSSQTSTSQSTLLAPSVATLPTMNSVKNNVPLIPTVVTPATLSSTAASDPNNNVVTPIPTIFSVPTSQAGEGVASNGSFTITEQDNASGNFSNNDEVDKALVNELVGMGFTGADLNKEVLRRNNYNLEKSLDELCSGAADWSLHLKELHGMGFNDDEMNRKVLVKNNGSLKHAVMDLISLENA